MLAPQLGERRLAALRRRPSPFRTSFALYELDAIINDGTTLRLMLKDVGRGALTAGARRAKPAFLYDPLREIEAYRTILAALVPGPAACYGTLVDPTQDRYWLLLERLAGVELYQVGDLRTWHGVAAWLARLHAGFAVRPDLSALATAARLIVYDEAFYRLWPRRARDVVGRGLLDTGRAEILFDWLARHEDALVMRLLAQPRTLLHGEFVASNVLVEERAGGLRVAPVDWEMAGLGPGLIDLAALVAGGWSEDEKRELALAYYQALPTMTRAESPFTSMLAALDDCRLQLALRWLGWAADWSPPADHTYDWLGEALAVAERIAPM